MGLAVTLLLSASLLGDYRPPAGDRPVIRGTNGAAILPGGRVIQPLGKQFPTGPGPSKIVASPSGKRIATANVGPERSSVTLLEVNRKGEWALHSLLGAASGGIAFANEKSLWVAEGATGRVRLIDFESGASRKVLDLNRAEVSGSFSGNLAFDSARNLLVVLDAIHNRVVLFDAHLAAQVAEIGVQRPESVALSPDGTRAYVTGAGALFVLDLSQSAAPKLVAQVASGDSGSVLATKDAVFISDIRDDSIGVIDVATNTLRSTIKLRIPGLESLRGVHPLGMAYDESHQWLLVAEAGMNSIGVIDVNGGVLLAHVPTGWFPTSLLIQDGMILVANGKGSGSGPKTFWFRQDSSDLESVFGRGSVSLFPLPDPTKTDFAKQTRLVLATNGFLALARPVHPAVSIHHVVIVVEGDETFDEVLGDVKLPDTPVAGAPQLARLGNEGYADGGKGRFSLHGIPVTPNQHALARAFSFSDNFYAGDPPDTEELRKHLEANHISFSSSENYEKAGEPLPEVLFISLTKEEKAGLPYAESYVAGNDRALGRIVEYFSHSPLWKETAIFVTGSESPRGRDHIDTHRTVFLGVSPWFRRGFVSHVNAGYPAILKSVFGLLGVPAMNLSDASAADIDGLFAPQPDFTPYVAQPIDQRLLPSEQSGTGPRLPEAR